MKIKSLTKSNGVKWNKNTLTDILRSALIAVIFSLIGVLILALVVKLTGIDSSVILPINQVLKILSILFGCLIGIKTKEKGALKGAIAGLIYTLISVFVFLILNGKLGADSFSYVDFVAGLAAGAISGIIAVNFGKNRRA